MAKKKKRKTVRGFELRGNILTIGIASALGAPKHISGNGLPKWKYTGRKKKRRKEDYWEDA